MPRISPAFVLISASLVFAVATCGRTDLDDQGFIPVGDGGAGGQNKGGSGGNGKGGSGGSGGGGFGGQGGFIGPGGSGGGQGGQGGRGGAGGGFGGQGGFIGPGGSGGGFGGQGGRGGAGGGFGGQGGRGGAGGGFGGQGGTPITPIPCGTTTCFPGKETCCIQPGGGTLASCIPVGFMCPGPSVGCVDTPSCGSPLVCCISNAGSSLQTACTLPVACLTTPGLILCTTDRDCIVPFPRCCNLGLGSFCSANCQ